MYAEFKMDVEILKEALSGKYGSHFGAMRWRIILLCSARNID